MQAPAPSLVPPRVVAPPSRPQADHEADERMMDVWVWVSHDGGHAANSGGG